jgi:peptide/nickel transport system substrate-binding protein
MTASGILPRRRLLVGAGAAGLGMATLGMAVRGGRAASGPARGGRLTFLLNPEPASLINLTTTSGAEQKISPKATEGLLCYDFALNPKPQLATQWSVNASGTEYTFALRKGVTWHDGKPFSAADVACSIRLLRQHHPRGRAIFANVVEVRTPDPLTAVIVLAKPAPYLIYALAASESPIVPNHLYGEGDPQANPANIAPIGTGPFRFKSWERGSHIVYERNPDYWDAPKPYIDELIVQFIPDAGARAAALETGELDLAGENPVPLTDIARLKALPHLAITTDGYSYNANARRIEFNLDNRYFAEPKVRQAVAHALDRQRILDVVYEGYGVVQYSPISPLLVRYATDDVEHYPFDLAAANRLLDEAGLPRRSGGARFAVALDYNPYGPDYGVLAAYARQALQRIGIDVSVRAQDFGRYVQRVFTERDFDFHVTGLSNLFDPSAGVQRAFWSKNFLPGVPFSNAAHYANPEVDRLLEAAAVEVDDDRRKALFRDFQRLVAVDIPSINLLTVKEVTISNRRVHDHTVTADGLRGNLADAYIAA